MSDRLVTDGPEGDAARLLALMEEVSRQAYPDGRQQHLEFVLWYALIHGPMTYGRYQIQPSDIERLRTLSQACDGWILFDAGPEGARRIPLREWQDLFSQNVNLVLLTERQSGGNKRGGGR